MNDDDADFKPNQNTSSNLTSLFGINKPRSNENQSLTYTPPKPPKPGEINPPAEKGSSSKNSGSEKLEIFISKNIHLHKLENENYINQGTAGIAIIGNHDLHLYQIILYKNNKEYLSKTHVQSSFVFTVLENNYASFYDNVRQNWSILFSSSADVQQFAKQIAIARYNSQIKQEKIIVQDLSPTGSMKANKKYVVDLEYSCSILEHNDIIPFKESGPLSVEIADNYAFPWQQGLTDCSLHCQRVVIVPHKLSAPWTNEIHDNNAILVQFNIISITSPKVQSRKSVRKRIQDESTTDSSADEDCRKERPASITDSVFLSRSHKADLVSRIAKMGHALPLKVVLASAPAESSDECSPPPPLWSNIPAIISSYRQSHPQQSDFSTSDGVPTCSIERQSCEPFMQQQKGETMKSTSKKFNLTGPTSYESNAQNYIKTDNTEAVADLKFTINKVSEKVDYVLYKLQNIDSANWDKEKTKTNNTGVLLDPASVISTIHDVMVENESLKMEMQQQKSKINEQSNKLHSLMELTQRYMEKSSERNSSESTSPDMKDLVAVNQIRTTEISKEANETMNQLRSEVDKYKEETLENRKMIKECQLQIESLIVKLKEKESLIKDMEMRLEETILEKEALESENKKQKREIQRFKEEIEGEKNTEVRLASPEELVEEIKKVMNAVNRKFQSHFDSDQFYSGKDIKAAIATTLKDVTMEYLKYRKGKPTLVSRPDDCQQEMSGKCKMEQGKSHHSTQSGAKQENLETEKAKLQRVEFADKNVESVGSKSVKEKHKSLPRAVETSSAASTRPNVKSRRSSTPISSASNREKENTETFNGQSQKESSRTDEGPKISQNKRDTNRPTSVKSSADVNHTTDNDRQHDGGNMRSNARAPKTLPLTMKNPLNQSPVRKPSSRLPSRGDECSKRDTSTLTGELESLLEDQEAERVEVEKLIVNLTDTVSDISRNHPPSHPSGAVNAFNPQTFTTSHNTSSNNNERLESEPNSRFGTEERYPKVDKEKLNNKGGVETVSIDAPSHTAEKSKRKQVKTPNILNLVTHSTCIITTKTAKTLPSDAGVSFENADMSNITHRETNQGEDESLAQTTYKCANDYPIESLKSVTEPDPFSDLSILSPDSNVPEILERSNAFEVDSVYAEIDTEKSSDLPKETVSKQAEVMTVPMASEMIVPFSSGCEASAPMENSEEAESHLEGKENPTEDINSKISISEREGNEENHSESASGEEQLSSSETQNYVKDLGSNATYGSPLYSEYYRSWKSSKPPPLPSEDEDGASESEAWL